MRHGGGIFFFLSVVDSTVGRGGGGGDYRRGRNPRGPGTRRRSNLVAATGGDPGRVQTDLFVAHGPREEADGRVAGPSAPEWRGVRYGGRSPPRYGGGYYAA